MPDAATTYKPGRLLAYLPGFYREDALLGQYLLAFELILLGRTEDLDFDPPGLEETIAGVARYFDPADTPGEFLPWLAGWVALTFRADLDEVRRRDFISKAVWLYRLRGTKKGLEESVRIYTRLGVTIDEQFAGLQVGVTSTVGLDTRLRGGAPYFFHVRTLLPIDDPQQLSKELSKHRRVIRDIIDMEKPAHTHYTLEIVTPTLQLGVNSTVGIDTLLGLDTD